MAGCASLMSMRSSTLGLVFSIVAWLSFATHVDAQRVIVPTLPAPPTAGEALFGSIAPDGRSFVYEVIEGQERSLWRLDLRSLHAGRVSPVEGVRYHPMWAPDSKHLAYWRAHPLSRRADGAEGLYVLDLDSLTERRVVKLSGDTAMLAGDVAWLDDGRILYRRMLEAPGYFDRYHGRFELDAVRLDGSPAARPPAYIERRENGTIASSGTAAAIMDSCCGGASLAIWVRNAAGARCVAGPLAESWGSERSVVFARDERRLYAIVRFIGTADTVDHLFAIDLNRHVAWRIGPADRAIASVSVTDAGDVAFTTFPDVGRLGALWMLAADSVREPARDAQRLLHCPPLSKPIADFVRHSDLPTVHWIESTFEDTVHHLSVFTATYGEANDIYPTRTGVRYGHRIGWIVVDDASKGKRFPLRSTDSFLFSDSLDARLRGVGIVAPLLRAFVVANAATPFETLVRVVGRDAGTLERYALENSVIISDTTIPFALRLRLAAMSDTLAAAAVELPNVRANPERLAQIADLPRYRWVGSTAADRAHERLAALMPSLVKNAKTLSERAALHAYMGLSFFSRMDTLNARLLHGLSPQRNPAFFAVYATRSASPGDTDVAFARMALRRLGSSPEGELLRTIERVRANELPGHLPEFILARTAPWSWRVVDAISRLDERFLRVRNEAALALAASSATPDSVVMLLAQELPRHRDEALALQLLWRATSDTSSLEVLYSLTELDSAKYRIVPEARIKLKMLERHRAPALDAPSPPRPSVAIAPSARSRDPQCRAPDDWSEQIRRAAGADAIVLDTLCARAIAALDTAFELPTYYDSAYVLRVVDGYVAAFPPARPDADVTLVRFDTAFVERSRRVVRVH